MLPVIASKCNGVTLYIMLKKAVLFSQMTSLQFDYDDRKGWKRTKINALSDRNFSDGLTMKR